MNQITKNYNHELSQKIWNREKLNSEEWYKNELIKSNQEFVKWLTERETK